MNSQIKSLNLLTTEQVFCYNKLTWKGEFIMFAKNSRQVKRVFESVAGILINPFSRFHLPMANTPTTIPNDLVTMTTGFRTLDNALGIGGLPYGRVTELMGPGGSQASSGAINIAARIAAKVQRKQQIVSIIDLSRNFDPWQAERCGLIAPHLLLYQPESIFEALTALEMAAQHEGLMIVIFGQTTNLLSQASPQLRKALLGRLRCIVKPAPSVFLFLTTAETTNPFSPHNYPAGFPLTELADLRLWVQDENWTHQAGQATSYKANITVIKNNLALAGRGADIRIKFTTPDSETS